MVARVRWQDASATYFFYDGALQRYGLVENGAPAYFLWEGLDLLEELNPDFSTKERFTNRASSIPGIAQLVESYRPAQGASLQRLYPLMDPRGSVVKWNQSDGTTVLASREFDAFGGLIPNGAVGTQPNRFGYQGQAWLETASAGGGQRLLASMFRFYDPVDGRFLQNEPLLANRATQHYIYVSQGPVSLVDPTGLQESGCNCPSKGDSDWDRLMRALAKAEGGNEPPPRRILRRSDLYTTVGGYHGPSPSGPANPSAAGAFAGSFLEAVASFPGDLFHGGQRTLEGLSGLWGSDRAYEIGDENERLRSILKEAITTVLSESGPIASLIAEYIDDLLAELGPACLELIREHAVELRRIGASISGAMAGRVWANRFARALAADISVKIASTELFKQVATKVGVTAGAGSTGIGLPISGLLLQGLGQRASNASRQLKREKPSLHRKLMDRNLDMLYFLVENQMDALDRRIRQIRSRFECCK